MLQSTYIQPGLFNKVFDFKIIVLSKISKIIRAFHLHIKHTGFIVNVNKDLSKLYYMTEGLKSIIATQKIEQSNAIKAHDTSKKSLLSFRHSYARLEKARFFRNSITRQLADNTLSNFYKIEYQLRSIAYSNENNFTEDKELLEFASELSLSSFN